MGGAVRSPAAAVVRVRGVVQGVGFRPFVWHLARELGLAGWVRNDAQGVLVAAEGDAGLLECFLERLVREAPPLARVDAVTAEPVPWQGLAAFSILESEHGLVRTAIAHDTAPCPACLAELFDPAGRRWRHAFLSCTHCGPRYTVTRRLPYDRAQTSLAPFPLCPRCAAEYADPADRRFHAETTCCPECGPSLNLLDARGEALSGDPLAGALGLLREGKILALKGVGGFQLLCDARNGTAVARLRRLKDREEKPFALLYANCASVAGHATVGDEERALLESPERPVALLRKKAAADGRFPGVAPGLGWLGALLPASPLHYLLFHEDAGRPAGVRWLEEAQPLALVCTSANPGGEPLVIANGEARVRLAGIADAFLMHDRDIVVRCDDSVVRARGESRVESRDEHADGAPVSALHFQRATLDFHFIRRARGYTPRAIRLARPGPAVLALGGWFKNTVCLTRGDEAFVSQHVGDLDNAAAAGFLEETVGHLLAILEMEPEIIAHDLHPDFHSSRFAVEFAARRGLPALAVQHHHAHVAAVLAEHGHEAPALGLALDGVGLGTDGGAWGGELLLLEGARSERLGHLAELALPGGDRAAREPWRMAASALFRLGRGGEIPGHFPDQAGAPTLLRMLEAGVRVPASSSMGRVFDAAAGLLGVKALSAFEGQAAMLLEGLAEAAPWPAPLKDGWRLVHGTLDFSPLLGVLADWEGGAAAGAALFHATVVAGLCDWVEAAARRLGVATVACSGGCLLNALVSARLSRELGHRGLKTLLASALPPNDGGLALGQAWVARASFRPGGG